MSSAFYPLGMNSYNNRLPQGGFKPWKSNNPVGITSGTIRPLTNNDPGNNFPAAFGKARPIKHYRKGASLTMPSLDNNKQESITIDRNLNRQVKSSTPGTLVKQLIDNPGSFSMSQRISNNPIQNGICMVSSYYPNKEYLTENPEPVTTTYPICCNAERKARRRVLPANTNLKKSYYTTHQQYMENRCQTYDQRIFNFVRPATNPNPNSKPGDPLSIFNTYVANCQPNGEIQETSEVNLVNVILKIMINQGIQVPGNEIATFQELLAFIRVLTGGEQKLAIEIFDAFMSNPYTGMPLVGPSNLLACKLVVYKPNNPQFAQQGAVSNRTLNLKLNVTTIEKNLASISKNGGLPNKQQTNICSTLKGVIPTCGGGAQQIPLIIMGGQ